MDARNDSNVPMIVTALTAIFGILALLVIELAPAVGDQPTTTGMVTSAAADRAGAIVLPTAPDRVDFTR